MRPEIKQLILDLFEIHAVKFGDFTLKNGSPTPIYIDLRLVISHPWLLKKIVQALNPLIAPLSFDMLCGVPYAALPLATAISLEKEIPMIMRRKEIKDYGTKKKIEGTFQKGQTCLIVEDVIVLGDSILETISSLHSEGLEVADAIVIVDREQGGKEKLQKKGIRLHSLITIFDLLKVLFAEKKISEETFRKVSEFLTTPLL